MRLYLSSYRLGRYPDRLVSLMRGNWRALVISNALDCIPDADRRVYAENVYDPIAELAGLGLEVEELDLRGFFGNPAGLAERLDGTGLVWAVGGNAFLLRRAMAKSGFDRIIVDRLAGDELVYGGFSAGAVVVAPTLRGIEVMDDPVAVAPGYDPDPIWEGLGLVEFDIIPHYRSDHAEAPAAERAARLVAESGRPFKTLRDGEVIIQDGEEPVLFF